MCVEAVGGSNGDLAALQQQPAGLAVAGKACGPGRAPRLQRRLGLLLLCCIPPGGWQAL